jgi:aryl-alcohol dehydrogenase-like predicted oxidoreductase
VTPSNTSRTIGEIAVGGIGFGAASLSLPDERDDEAAVETIRAAVDAGVRLIDTALAYTTVHDESHSEALVRRALQGSALREEVLVATKGGHYRAGPTTFPFDGRPETLRRHCEISLRTLGVERIDLYQLHHPDPQVPFAESVGTLRELRDAGKIARVGISNVNVDQLETARAIVDIASVQNHFSLYDDTDRPVLDRCTALGIAYLAYSPLKGSKKDALVGVATDIGRRHGVSAAQVVLRWNLRQSDRLICIVGATRQRTILDSLRAPELALTDAEAAELTAAIRSEP